MIILTLLLPKKGGEKKVFRWNKYNMILHQPAVNDIYVYTVVCCTQVWLGLIFSQNPVHFTLLYW